jgi:hypothetical protein
MAEVWKRTFGPVQDRVPSNPVKRLNWGNDFADLNCWKKSVVANNFRRVLGKELRAQDECCSCTRTGGHSCCMCGN